jgi:hypothetical protein
LGCAAPKNPDQGITAIAAGFWKMLPVLIFRKPADELWCLMPRAIPIMLGLMNLSRNFSYR